MGPKTVVPSVPLGGPVPPPPIVTVYGPTDSCIADSKLPPPPVLSPVTEDLYPPAPPPP